MFGNSVMAQNDTNFVSVNEEINAQHCVKMPSIV